MLSGVLNSETAIEVNIHIIRIFTRMRNTLLQNKGLLLKIQQIEKNLLKQDSKNKKHDEDIQYLFEALKQLLSPAIEPRKRIGFKKDEYCISKFNTNATH